MVNFTGTPTGTCNSLISRTPSGCCKCHIHCFPTTKISVEASGGRAFRIYRLADQKNNPKLISVGIALQRISSGVFFSICGGTSSSDCRRYLTMKKKIKENITTVKNSVIAVSVKCSRSTPSAIDEAAGGRISGACSAPMARFTADSKSPIMTEPITLVAPAAHNVRCEPAEKFQFRLQAP